MKTLVADVDRINEVRIKNGLTVKALAKKAKRSSSAVYAVLRGDSQGPSIIKSLCEALGLSPDEIWLTDGKRKQEDR